MKGKNQAFKSAYSELGGLFEFGHDVEKDRDKAEELYKKYNEAD